MRLDAGTIRGERPSIEWPALADDYVTMSVQATRTVIDTLGEHIDELERTLLSLMKPTPMYRLLNTVAGIGPVAGLRDRAGDRRHRPFPQRWGLRLVLPLGR